MKIVVLGAGMVGRAMAFDLSAKFDVTSVDVCTENLSMVEPYGVKTYRADLRDSEQVKRVVQDFDLVVCAVPGFMGYSTVRTCIEARKSVVDISFMPEDFMELDPLAKEEGVTVIADFGVAPGMPNIILGHYNQLMEVSEFFYMVGGLPKVRNYPYQYKAPFSPVDVLEEYTRPARCMENGRVVTKPAMSEIEMYNFPQVGDLEGFNTDGLRSLLKTMAHIPNMKEKTLRYPGHIDIVKILSASGFFSTDPVSVDGVSLSPMAMTSKILFDKWKLQPNEPEITVMQVLIKGVEKGTPKVVTYNLYDEYDPATEQWSMARTTGYTATAGVNLLAAGNFREVGVFAPEMVGAAPGCFDLILDYLRQRGVNYISE
ncbi:MAG: saccharopine dehydrogenase C-terminal domain-containing protein [Tenuifilaceae bacterium]|jgi:saccharopine dehydrogenase-like NADP-dependent oxidoreductase|nr:saccharopine dehydrogenase C-terminal domain-containing protein [Tenuifilaceae bacterium]